MTLTLHGATLVIYLVANVFRMYIVYCTRQIFFDRPPIRRGWAIVSYLLYWVGVSAAYLLANELLLTFAVNISLTLLITANYRGSWQRRIAAVVFSYVLALLCETIVLVILDTLGMTHFSRFND